MGFTSGFIGGLSLTSSLLYFTLHLHQRNRQHQSTLLRQQALVLTNIVSPLPPPPPATARESRVSLAETAKDKWNGELEGLVKRMQDLNWNVIREDLEDNITSVCRKLFKNSREQGPET